MRGMWAHKWTALIVTSVLSTAGWVGVYLMPNVYEANAQFYVDANSRLRDVVQQLGMEPNVTSRVYLVRQAMLGRVQLERVARETDLDARVVTPEEEERMLDGLAENINISTGRGREAQNLFTISYQNADRTVAYNVVREMLNSFVEDVLKQKDSDTERTQEFLFQQLGYYRELLETTETELQAFKLQYPAYSLGDRADYFSQMQVQEELLKDYQSQRKNETTRRNELRRQLGNVNPYAPSEPGSTTDSPLVPGNVTSQTIYELQRMRRGLLLRVTDIHPDVVAISEQIRVLQLRLDQEMREVATDALADGVSTATNPVYVEIQLALSASNVKIAEIDSEMDQISERLNALKGEVDQAPGLESQFIRLTRDYQNYQELYNEVLESTERERIGRVGDEKDVISFNIINPPRASIKPAAPNRPLLLLAVIVVAVGVGASIALLQFLLRPTCHNESDLSSLVGFPVIGTVSLNYESSGIIRARGALAFGIASASLVGLFVCIILAEEPASAWLRNTIQVALI